MLQSLRGEKLRESVGHLPSESVQRRGLAREPYGLKEVFESPHLLAGTKMSLAFVVKAEP